MLMQGGRVLSYFLGFLAMLFWGLSFIWSKVCFDHLTPLSTIFLRLALSVGVLFTYLILARKLKAMERRDRLVFLASGFFSPFLYFIGENYGLNLVTPTTAAVIIATIPLLTPVAAFLFLSERLSQLNIVGILVSFVGVLAMIISPNLELGASLEGVGLLFLAVFAATAYALLIRNLARRYSPMNIILWQNLIGSLLFLPFFLWFDLRHLSPGVFTRDLVFSLLQLAVFASSLAFIFFIRLIREVGVSKASVMTNMIPVITALTSFLVLNEHFSLLKIFGIATVISGLILTQIPRLSRKQRLQETKAAIPLTQKP